MNQSKPQLEIYFFPAQEVNANPEHDPSAVIETAHKIDRRNGIVDGSESAMWVQVDVRTDEEKSVNPPYFVRVLCFVSMSLIRNDDDTVDEQFKELSLTTATQVAIGAIREHLMAMTSRGPWGALVLDTVISVETAQQV